jgi:hypothetical protein
MGSAPHMKRSESVSLDWRANLSPAKNHANVSILHRLETSYCMFSINLDEAIGMRRAGRVNKAYQLLSVAPALCEKLTFPLIGLLRAMTLHARHFGTAPNLSCLDPGNFQHTKSQRTARFSSVLSHVLLTRRSQFLHKISALSELVEDLGISFATAAEELEEGSIRNSDRYWELLDASHYDLNTCLREAVVLLKSFLLALPEKQLVDFQATYQLEVQPVRTSSRVLSFNRNLAHRRLATLKGQ